MAPKKVFGPSEKAEALRKLARYLHCSVEELVAVMKTDAKFEAEMLEKADEVTAASN